MLHTFFFSPSETTRKYAIAMTEAFGGDSQLIDLTHGQCEIESELIEGDTVLFISPVYAGRVPAMAVDLFRQIDGHGMKAIVAVVYGNRDYDDALLELADIASEDGFKVVAAGAFIAQHCIFPKVAAGRPDAGDIDKISEFADLVRQKNGNGASLDIKTVKGNRPYKKAASVPLHPAADKKHCNRCGICARNCQTEAIDNTDPTKTDSARCITCCRCINICPQSARSLGGLLYRVAGWKFVRDNSRRLEPEWFI